MKKGEKSSECINQDLENYVLWDKCSPLLIFVSIVLLDTESLIYLPTIYGHFQVTLVELRSCDTDCMACKTKNMYYLSFTEQVGWLHINNQSH